jgi:hypothetical protein
MDQLVPPRRLGRLLADARESQGVTMEAAAEQLARTNIAIDLRDVEAGRVVIDDRQVEQLAQVYGIETGSVIPQRSKLIVDMSEGIIRDEKTQAAIQVPEDRHEALTRYLALVYTMRNIAPGNDLTLRVEDMQVLAEAFGTDSLTVESELRTMIASQAPEVSRSSKLLQKRVLVPAVGVLVAVTAIGALIFVQANQPTPAPTPAQSVPAPSVDPGVPLDQLPPAPVADVGPAGISQERGPDGQPGPELPRS